MRAIVCTEWGDPSLLQVQDLQLPEPSAGMVKVRVRAAGVNFADTLLIRGQYQVRPEHPFTPGMEFAGEVLALGEGVTHLRVGDRVMGIIDYGAYAEEALVPALTLLPMPESMNFQTAAAFPVVYGTSHLALWHRGNLQAEETLLVFGAAGGVGLSAVEIGKRMGAKVIACASSPEKLALAEQYGADHLINYSVENIRDRVKEITGGKGADVIFDPVGGEAFDQAIRSIAWEGRLLVIGFASGEIPQLPVNLTLVKNCSVVGVYWGAYTKRDPNTLLTSLQTLAVWHAEGRLNPHISRTYTLDEAADAMNALSGRTSTGKLVIIP